MGKASPGAAVLVIEDDADVRETMRLALEEEGYHVLTAADGASGLAVLRAHRQPLVALVDWLMPDMDGAEVLARVAADATIAARHAYVLMTAATDRVENAAQFLPPSVGVTILGKPFDLDYLLGVVAEAATRLASED